MSTVFGYKSTRGFDRVVNTKVIPAISEAYGELVSDMAGTSNDTKDEILAKVTEHLIKLLTSECEDNVFKKLSDKRVKEYLGDFSEDECRKHLQGILHRQ